MNRLFENTGIYTLNWTTIVALKCVLFKRVTFNKYILQNFKWDYHIIAYHWYVDSQPYMNLSWNFFICDNYAYIIVLYKHMLVLYAVIASEYCWERIMEGLPTPIYQYHHPNIIERIYIYMNILTKVPFALININSFFYHNQYMQEQLCSS